MKKVVLTVLAGIILAGIIVSCTPDPVDEPLTQEAIDNDEVKDDDI